VPKTESPPMPALPRDQSRTEMMRRVKQMSVNERLELLSVFRAASPGRARPSGCDDRSAPGADWMISVNAMLKLNPARPFGPRERWGMHKGSNSTFLTHGTRSAARRA
jgi:hypothetical protein